MFSSIKAPEEGDIITSRFLKGIANGLKSPFYSGIDLSGLLSSAVQNPGSLLLVEARERFTHEDLGENFYSPWSRARCRPIGFIGTGDNRELVAPDNSDIEIMCYDLVGNTHASLDKLYVIANPLTGWYEVIYGTLDSPISVLILGSPSGGSFKLTIKIRKSDEIEDEQEVEFPISLDANTIRNNIVEAFEEGPVELENSQVAATVFFPSFPQTGFELRFGDGLWTHNVSIESANLDELTGGIHVPYIQVFGGRALENDELEEEES